MEAIEGPTIWFSTVKDFLSLLPEQTLRLDAEGYAALSQAGLSAVHVDAAVTGLRWQGQVVVMRGDDGVKSVRLVAEGESIDRPTEPPVVERVKRLATEAQKNYLRVLGYQGVKPIDQLTASKAGRHIDRLKREESKKHRQPA